MGRRGNEQTRNRQTPAYILAPSQLLEYQRIGTNPHAAREQFWWQPVPEPSPAHHHLASTKPPPAGLGYVQTGEDLPQKPVPIPAQDSVGRSWLTASPLTFLMVSDSALLGALASNKLRLLATPSECSKRLF